MQRIACSWMVWEWTQSAFWVGFLVACDLLPVVFISPFAGVAADRWNKLKLNLVVQVISIINTILLAILLALGQLGLVSVLLIILVQGVLTAATQPARFAMVQQMVSRQDVGSAVGLNSAFVNIARLIGPAAAGFMMVHWNILSVLIVNAAITILFLPILLHLKLSPLAKKPKREGFVAEMSAGFAYIFKTRTLSLILLAMLGGGALVRSIVELMPVIAAETFGNDVRGLSILTGATALGAIVSGMSIRRHSTAALFYKAPVWWILGALSGLVLTLVDMPWLAVVAAIALGAVITRGLVSTQTFVQLTTPDHLRGRALSVFGLIARGSPALGALGIGYAADRWGLYPAVMGAAIILACLFGLLARPIYTSRLSANEQVSDAQV